MKKMILSLFYMLIAFPAMAQEAKFMGIPIKGNIHDFAERIMADSVFQKSYEDRHGIILTGRFVDIQCLFILKSDHGEIHEVDVKFPSAELWKDLETTYYLIKKYLIKKFGHPLFEEERFLDTSFPSLRYDNVLKGECFYSSEFKISDSDGYARLFIKRFSDDSASVVLRYSNGAWSQDKFKSIMNDLVGVNGADDVRGGHAERFFHGYGTYELRDRVLLNDGLPIPSYDIQEEGRVVVDIKVNPQGKVVRARINVQTNTDNKILHKSAIKAAIKARFNKVDENEDQPGTITYYFRHW